MTLPQQVFLRQTDGAPIGPFALTALEVLFDARIVDERTPVSSDGFGFRAIGDWPDVLNRLKAVKAALGRGEDPWPEDLPSAPEGAASTADLEAQNLIRVLLEKAGAYATGIVSVESPAGEIEISLKEGKVVAISTTIPDLVLSEYLLDRNLVDEERLAAAEANAPAVGGDLGAALVSQGLIEPHVYFEALVGWARWVLGQAVSPVYSAPSFAFEDVPNPSVPLGFDRLGLAIELVRDAYDIDDIRNELAPKKRSPVIPSQVEGVNIEDCKLRPRELRVLNRVNGVRNVQQLLEELGGSADKERAVLHALFFAERAGFIVLGEDYLGRKQRAEAAQLEALHARLSQQNDFEILGVDEKSADEEVRARFHALMKVYDPTRGSVDVDPALVEARKKLSVLIRDAFERQEFENDRYKYAHELEQGNVVNDASLDVQSALQAETAYKKAEILVKVRKHEEALQHIDEAISLNPTDIEFQIQRHYIAYLVDARRDDPKTTADEAIKRVAALLKDNPDIASGYLVLGHLHKAVNKPDLALKYFEKVLEYDEHHPVAKQEVRLGSMRRGRESKRKKRWI